SSDVGLRFAELSLGLIAAHLLSFPWKIAACLLPWSLLLPAYLWPSFRRLIGNTSPMVVFLSFAWLVALPTCWLVPNARPRYLMPLYPLAAPLIGLVVERIFELCAADRSMVRLGWRAFASAGMLAVLGGAAAVTAASWIKRGA